MGLMQEGLRRSGEIRNALAPVNLNLQEIKASYLPARSDRSESRIPELLSLVLGEKDTIKHAEEPKLKRADGFEPFVNPKPSEDTLFVNGYQGNFAQKMELNRKGIERALHIAHLDGKVVLAQFIPSRKSSSEAQDNELVVKRQLFFGEKTEEDNKESLLHRVVPTPEGWRIEINDARITEELTEKKIGGKDLQRVFIRRFNGAFKKGLFECVWREKFTSEKDRENEEKLIMTFLGGSASILTGAGAAIFRTPFSHIVFLITLGLDLSAFYIANHSFMKRSTDNIAEAFLPPLEIDKVARAWTFLSLKGRKLVREAGSETK